MTEPFYKQKGWWKSGGVWTGIIASVYAGLQFLGLDLPFGLDVATLNELVLAMVGVLGIYFRVRATEEIAPAIIPTAGA